MDSRSAPTTLLFLSLTLTASAFAQLPPPDFQGPLGANYAGVDTLFGVDGDSVAIEHPTSSTQVGIDDNHHLGTRLLGQWDFEGHAPPGWPPDSAQIPPPGCSSPDSIPAADGSSAHARLVANLAAGAPAGTSGVYVGVAPKALVFAGNIDSGTDFDAGYHTTRAAMDWIWTFAPGWAGAGGAPPIYNLSFGYPGNDDGANDLAVFLDWWTAGGVFFPGRSSLIVVAAGNDSVVVRKPGDLYNGITVGALDSTLTRRLGVSGHVLTPDLRGKPDLLAPGQNVTDGVTVSFGTSFAAPQVSGAAALLLEYGLWETFSDFARTAKAILLNSARKRDIGGENDVNAVCRDHANTAADEADYDYLDAGALRVGASGAGPKTEYWTPAVWSRPTAASPFATTAPLDDEQGTGVLDVHRALLQMGGSGLLGENPPGGGLPPIGWGRSFLDTSSTVQSYTLQDTLDAGTFLTATLCWNRSVNENDPFDVNLPCSTFTGPGGVDSADTYAPDPVQNLDLKLFWNDQGVPQLVAHSASGGNVEHLHVPVPETGEYRMEVSLVPPDSIGTHFTLAWWVQEPDSAGGAVGVVEPRPAIQARLAQNTPNPFAAGTAIRFELPRKERVAIRVYDVRGRLVRTLFDGLHPPGADQVLWDGTDAKGRRTASGIYFYRLTTEETVATRKMIVLR